MIAMPTNYNQTGGLSGGPDPAAAAGGKVQKAPPPNQQHIHGTHGKGVIPQDRDSMEDIESTVGDRVATRREQRRRHPEAVNSSSGNSLTAISAQHREIRPEGDRSGKSSMKIAAPVHSLPKNVSSAKPTKSWLTLVYEAIASGTSPSAPTMTRPEVRAAIAAKNPYYKKHKSELYSGIYNPLSHIHRFYQVNRADGTPAWGLTAGWHIDADSGQIVEQDKDVDDTMLTSNGRLAVEVDEEEEPGSNQDGPSRLRAELLAEIALPRPIASLSRHNIDESDANVTAASVSEQVDEMAESLAAANTWETTDSEILSDDSNGSIIDDDQSFVKMGDREGELYLRLRFHENIPAD